jgi:DNA-directed RNA polymerase subunit H (RpoH/RPB5)
MRHAKRTVLTADDVDSALSLRNVEVNHLPWIKFQDNNNVG